jgi:hypothetical protein
MQLHINIMHMRNYFVACIVVYSFWKRTFYATRFNVKHIIYAEENEILKI